MQLGTSAIPLLPAVAVGVAAVLAGLVLWGVHRVNRSSGATPRPARPEAGAAPEPEARDWTGEAAVGAADPPRAPRPLTVADAVAARGADTEPMAAVTVATPPTAWGATAGPDAPREDDPPTRSVPRHASAGAPPENPESPERPVSASQEDPSTAPRPPAAPEPDGPDVRSTWSAPVAVPDRSDDHAHGTVRDLDEDTDEDAAAPEPVGTGSVPPPWSPARTASAAAPECAGSPEPVSFAVAQALAARAVRRARGGPDVPDAAADDPQAAVPDARDRLLSVLLTDPVTALGATTELDDTRARIDQLGDVLRCRRADLAAAVHRLHASGLTGAQIGRLAGLARDDVRQILEQPSGEGGGGR